MIRTARLAAMIPVIAAVTVTAGPLDPPPGPVTPTQKTLSEVEPRIAINATNTPGDADSLYKITQSGSYYLTSNTPLIPTGYHGIEVVAADVTIDLNGFTIRSLIGSLHGVNAASSAHRLTVRNGNIYLMGGSGLHLDVDGCRVEGVTCHACGSDGIMVGSGAILSNCIATSSYRGFFVAPGAVLVNCVARSNTRQGFASNGDFGVTKSHTFRDCEADSNGGAGFDLISPAVLEGCTSSGNDEHGFFVPGGRSTLKGCVAVDNQFSGFSIGASSHISGCVAKSNVDSGINSNVDCVITSNQCTGNVGNGVKCLGGCLVSENLVSDNSGAGVCTSGDHSRIERNHSFSNAAGYTILGDWNVLDGNSANDNSVSFDIDGVDNLVIRNTATGGSPNYSISAGNSVAPRVSVANSDGWAGIANANHPWANFGH